MAAATRGLKSFSGELKGGLARRGGGGGLQVPGLRRPDRRHAVRVRVPALDRARQLQAPAQSRRARRAGGRRGRHRALVPEVGTPSRPTWLPASPTRCRRPRRSSSRTRRPQPAAPDGPKLKILPPAREAPIGLLRLEADVEPPITKVEFYLEDKLSCAHEAAVHGRDRPRRGAAPADGARGRLRRLGKRHRRGRLGDQPGQRAARRQDPAAAGSGGGQGARQGRRAVDRRRRREAGRALPRRQEAQDLDRAGPTK